MAQATDEVSAKHLGTIKISTIVSDEMLEDMGKDVAIAHIKDGLIHQANNKIAETYGDRKAYAVHGEPIIRKGFLDPDGFIKGHKEATFIIMTTDVYDAE